MKPSTRATRNSCLSALRQGFVRVNPGIELSAKGYVREAMLNLEEGIGMADFEDDLRQGDGNELEGKFRAVHSSSALAVNTFAPFKSEPAALRLPIGGKFARLTFERKCPHGIAGRRPPNVDVVLEGPDGVVAIESKCLEPLSSHVAKFAPAYDAEIQDARRQSAWFREMHRLMSEPRAYRWLDAAQLVKHAFGIAHCFDDRSAILLYLFWEPSNAGDYPVFAEHRAEVGRFASAMADGGPAFAAISYPELWHFWRGSSGTPWLQKHVARLTARYEVSA